MNPAAQATTNRKVYAARVLLICFVLGSSSLAQQAASKAFPQRFKPDVARERARPPRGNMATMMAQRQAPDRVLVRFRSSADAKLRQQLHADVGATRTRSIHIVPGLEIVHLKAGVRVADAVRQYRRNPNVRYAEPDYRVHHMGQPNDPNFAELWGLHNTGANGGTPGADIKALEAWNITAGSPDVVVGVTDTGVDYTHPDLAVNIWNNPADCNANGLDDDGNGYVDDCHGIDTYNGDSDPMDDAGHGTHVAGTIGAVGNNSIGVVGVNWTVKIVACKFLGSDGGGWDSGAIACLEYFNNLRNSGVHVVATNNSWGGGGYSQALYDAIDAHRQAGILFIAAAGNAARNNDQTPDYPSGFGLPNIISVAATTRSDGLAEFSNFGAYTVHLGAPGAEILSTFPNGDYVLASGTSMAAPHVTGVAALLAAQDAGRDWRAIRNLILASGDTIPALTNTVTGKRLNANAALTCSNSEILRHLKPVGMIASTTVGVTVELQALHISCAAAASGVVVTVDPGATTVTLTDDGTGNDIQADDGVYSGSWTPSASGTYTLTFTGGDQVTVHVLSPYKFASETYSYRTITGTSLNFETYLKEFDWVETPFPVKFGGGSFSRLGVNLNGTISVTDAFLEWWNEPLPTPGASTLIAPSWTPLWAYNGTPQNVFWATRGQAPNRELVVEWRNVEGACYSPATITFQIVFFENGSDVVFNYKDMIFGVDSYGNDCTADDNGASATSGIQVGPAIATQYSYFEPFLTNGTALRWSLGTPPPQLDFTRPFSATVGDPGFELEAWGRNFMQNSSVQWNGSSRPSKFVDSTHLTATITPSDLLTDGAVQITVTTPNGGTSLPSVLNVYRSYPVPTISSLSTTEVELGSAALFLGVTGSGFTDKSVARISSRDAETTAYNPTFLQMYVPESNFEHAGTLPVTVFNPAPGGGESLPATLTVKNPVPWISFLSPSFGRAGGPAFQLHVYPAAPRVSNAVVRWNGADRPTSVDMSSGIAYASISAEDLAQSGSAEVTLYNPPPGGGVSPPRSFDILLPPINDDIAQAITISVFPFNDSRDIRAASPGALDPLPSCGDRDLLPNSVWYRHDAAETGQAFFGANSNSARLTSVWTGQPGALAEVACGFGAWWGNDVSIDTVAGTTYWIMISVSETSVEVPYRFFAYSAAPVPVLAAVTPAIIAGGWETPLRVTGSSFRGNSHLHWDGSDVASTYVSNIELSAMTAASATVGVHDIVVHTPEPGGGMSSALSVTVTGYQLGAAPPFTTVNAGQPATFSLTVTPDNGGFDKQVTFACINPPASISCSFSLASGTPGTSALTSTLTVSTSTFAAHSNHGKGAYLAWIVPSLFACAGLVTSANRRRRIGFGLLLLFAIAIPLFSCGGGGGGGGTPAPTSTNYTVKVGASSGSLQRTTSLTLTVRR